MTSTRLDRIAGALALSAVGDALGLPRESLGLSGLASPIPLSAEDWLPPAENFREPDPNPWNIWAAAQHTLGLSGVVSDDSATKIALTEPWLASTNEVSEASFQCWLETAELDSMPRALASEYLSAWDGQRRGVPAGSFYNPEFAVNWGPFVFGSVGLTRWFVPCSLDHPNWGWCSRLFQDLLEAAIDGETFRSRLESRAELLFAWNVGAQGDREGIWKAELVPFETAFRPFHPLVQLMGIVAALAAGEEDPMLALRLVATSAGDTDTVAAHAGLILGARHGLSAIRRIPEVSMVEAAVEKLFGVTTEFRTESYDRWS